ncbi:MAG: GntR family transcriptional regulator [Lachnospiraceae bacterium]|nr:GntR family transcriptional regulator [Lachnospiraceae bacterium]
MGSSGSLNDQTYNRLRRDIMTLALMPGEPVSVAKIAERYNVSRTPAREAIVRLETDALVDIYPQIGTKISKIDVNRAKQEWFVRKTLEMGVIDGLFENVSDDDIPRMHEFCHKMELVSDRLNDPDMTFEYLRCDNEFHAIAYYVAGQELAASIVSTSMTHYNRVRLLVDMENANKDRTLATHAQLIRCIEAKDKEAYRKLLWQHMGYFEKDIEVLREARPELFND